ncbi:hypothetical protein KRP22_011369 [Phytophthora ramorum]|uniref:Polygalacturonase n=1 Tax=Phytophthora ramorum TaxID=164328 RepID=UPI0030976D2B|nr:Polygalacturonase [Phytophthora ramorum]KAH7499956.1 Polygalacturonase [Phytophthora ramorum]
MKFFSPVLASSALAIAAVCGSPMMRQEEESSSCTLSGTYTSGTDVSSCSTVTIKSLKVPAGVTLDLTDVKSGASIVFSGTTAFGEKKWSGPLVLLTGTDLTVSGTGTLDGQSAWYWKQGTSIIRPVFLRMSKVISSTVSDFTIKNSPYRTFSILSSSISSSDTASGLTVKNNKIVDSVNGIRIKTIIDDYGEVTDVTYTDNTLSNVENAIVIHGDYSKSEGGYTGSATSKVTITDITIDGLTGSADQVYDILVDSDVVSGWTFSGIDVSGDTGSCSGEPSGVPC